MRPSPMTPCFTDFEPARICVVGIGGAGGNAVAHMHASGIRNVECLAMNTDAQALALTRVDRQILLGRTTDVGPLSTRGSGAGGNPTHGACAAEESEATIADALAGANLVFLAVGLGGGTGTGAGPVVARIARQMGALVVGLATLPFAFEGQRRAAAAVSGLDALRAQVDTLITIPNERIFGAITPQTNLRDAFRVTDEVLRQGVAGVADLVTVPGLINLDLADLRAVMTGAGHALLAIGEADGADRASHAARLALSSALLGIEVHDAKGLVFNILGGDDLTLMDVQRIAETIGAAAQPDATLLFGAVTDPAFTGRIRVTVIATGMGVPAQPQLAKYSALPPSLPEPFPTVTRPRGVPSARQRVPAIADAWERPASTWPADAIDDTAVRYALTAQALPGDQVPPIDARIAVASMPTIPLPATRVMTDTLPAASGGLASLPLASQNAPPIVRQPVMSPWRPEPLDLPTPHWSPPRATQAEPTTAQNLSTALLPLASASPHAGRTRVTHDSSLIPAYLRRFKR